MTADELEATWAGARDARRRQTVRHYAAMRVARWRWLLVPMVVVVAGCLPHASALPESFIEYIATGTTGPCSRPSPRQRKSGRTRGSPPRTREPMFRGSRDPGFGRIDCQVADCGRCSGPAPVRTRAVLYPDCTDGKDIGWVVVDPAQGLGGAHVTNTPCGPVRDLEAAWSDAEA